MIGRVFRFFRFILVEAIVDIKILHADHIGYASFEFFENFRAALLLKDRPGRIEIPVVVIIEGAGRMTAPLRPRVDH